MKCHSVVFSSFVLSVSPCASCMLNNRAGARGVMREGAY